MSELDFSLQNVQFSLAGLLRGLLKTYAEVSVCRQWTKPLTWDSAGEQVGFAAYTGQVVRLIWQETVYAEEGKFHGQQIARHNWPISDHAIVFHCPCSMD